MVSKTLQPRAKIAHKLAKYIRANPVHIKAGSAASRPSTTHLTLGGAPQKKMLNSNKTWYPADDEKTPFVHKRNVAKVAVPRKSIEAGSIVILLSGPHRGRRVVVLKHLENNTLLVTGPYAINGVPLKRVNAAYVIATSTKVALDGVNVNIDSTFFKKQTKFTKNQLKNASETRIKHSQAGVEATAAWKAQAKTTQKTIDTALIANIAKVQELKGYLSTRFAITSGLRPHELKF